MWKQQESLAPGCAICPNLYRLGLSLADWATAVLRVADADEPLVVIGSSMGGACAIEMAHQSPHRIAGLVLVGAKAAHRREPMLRDRYIEALRTDGIMGLWPEVRSYFGENTQPGTLEHACSMAQRQSVDELVNAVRVFHSRADRDHVLSSWPKPYLVVTGDSDPLFPRSKAERVSQIGRDGRLRVISDCGHFVNLEQPDEFNRIIGDFVRTLDRNSGTPP